MIPTSTTNCTPEMITTKYRSISSLKNEIHLERSTAMTPMLELFLHLQNQSTDTSGVKEKDGNCSLSSLESVPEEVFKGEEELEEQMKREHATQLFTQLSTVLLLRHLYS